MSKLPILRHCSREELCLCDLLTSISCLGESGKKVHTPLFLVPTGNTGIDRVEDRPTLGRGLGEKKAVGKYLRNPELALEHSHEHCVVSQIESEKKEGEEIVTEIEED